MTTLELTEKRNKKKGLRISIFIHAMLLLIAFLYFFPAKSDKEPYPPPVVVNFTYAESSLSKYAHAESGKTRKKTEAVKKVETPKPKKVEVKTPEVKIKPKQPVIDPTPTEPIVTDATQEDSPIEAVEEEIEIEDPEPEPIPEPEEEVVEQEVLTEEDIAELEEEASEAEESQEAGETGSTDGNSGNDENASILDGEEGGTGKGNLGDGPGASSGNDGDEGIGEAGSGTGDYDGSGNGVFGRKIIKRNWGALFDAGETSQSKGNNTIAVKMCVNRAGDVVYVEILDTETTETDREKLKRALNAAKGYKVEPDPSAPREQCGKLLFDLSINALRGG